MIGKLEKKPAVMGHSTGGLFAQMLAGRGLSAATVAIDRARGVPALPRCARRELQRGEILEIVAVVVNMNDWTRIKLAEGAMPGLA